MFRSAQTVASKPTGTYLRNHIIHDCLQQLLQSGCGEM